MRAAGKLQKESCFTTNSSRGNSYLHLDDIERQQSCMQREHKHSSYCFAEHKDILGLRNFGQQPKFARFAFRE